MKIKSITNEESIYDIVRYNDRILPHHKKIEHGVCNIEKKDYSALVLLSLIKKIDILKDKKSDNLINDALSEAIKKYDNTFAKDNGVI